MPSRPIAQSVVISTATGNFGPVYFGHYGPAYRYALLDLPAAGSTAQTIVGNVQGSLGGSGVWTNLLTLSTSNTTGASQFFSTGGVGFDKLRVSLSANNQTTSRTVWLAATESS